MRLAAMRAVLCRSAISLLLRKNVDKSDQRERLLSRRMPSKQHIWRKRWLDFARAKGPSHGTLPDPQGLPYVLFARFFCGWSP